MGPWQFSLGGVLLTFAVIPVIVAVFVGVLGDDVQLAAIMTARVFAFCSMLLVAVTLVLAALMGLGVAVWHWFAH